MRASLTKMTICSIVLTGPASADMTLGEMMAMQLDMFNSSPCFDLLVLQDNFSNSNTVEFEKVMFWHSYVMAIGDKTYPESDNRFADAMGLLVSECLKQPTLPLSQVVQQLHVQ